MSTLRLTGMKLSQTDLGTRIDYQYEAPDILKAYIKGSPLFVEFPCDMDDVPQSILSIPFVGIMSTVTMLMEVNIEVPVLDESFLKSIHLLSEVYENMYPHSKLNLSVCAKRTENARNAHGGGTALCFTGGVDATSAMIGLLDQSPVLLNIWGGDIRLTDSESHEELDAYLGGLTKYLGLNYCFIKTNGREMFYEDELGHLTTRHVGRKNEYGWWATIAHSLSMISTAIPWLWKTGLDTLCLGSTHAAKEQSYDANNIELLNALSSQNWSIQIADGDLVRNEKVTKIVKWKEKTKAPIQLKVCWRRTAGKNCSSCEKCYRTILNIMSNHGDPNDFGFEVNGDTLMRIKAYLESHHVGVAFWGPIQQAFLAEREYWENDPEIAWILSIKLNSFKSLVMRIRRRIFRKK